MATPGQGTFLIRIFSRAVAACGANSASRHMTAVKANDMAKRIGNREIRKPKKIKEKKQDTLSVATLGVSGSNGKKGK